MNISNQQYGVLHSLKGNGLVLTKTAYLQGTCPEHAHENARFVFVLKGAFDESYANRSRHCRASMVIFRPAGERHWENYGHGVVCLNADVGASWLQRLHDYRIELLDSMNCRSASLSLLAANLHRELIIGDQVSLLAIEALLLQSVVELVRHRLANLKGTTRSWVARAKDFIDAEYARNLTLTEISRNAGVHPVHLARVFRSQFGCTVAEYLRRKRVEAACVAIAESDAALVDIAMGAGFSDQSQFCKTFKRLTHMTPTEYRSHVRSG